MSDPAALPPLREVIARYELTAKKQLGQNFLLDLNLTGRIARVAGSLAEHTVIEVGPGPGGLTRALLTEGARKVIAIERDARVLPALAEIAAAYPGRVEVVEADALEVDYRSLASGPTRLVANLPYNIATPLLTGWLTLEPWPSFFDSLTLMFQREVAERIVAKPGDKAFGRLGVLAGWRTEAKIAFDVDRRAFTPAPKVTSSVVHLVPKSIDDGVSAKSLEAVTKAAFGQRRKMLRQSLKSLGVPVAPLLDVPANLKGDERAEELPVAAFLQIAEVFDGMRAIQVARRITKDGTYSDLDAAILAETTLSWRKVARIVSALLSEKPPRWPEDIIGARVIDLVEAGRLEVAGDPLAWRFSEIRLPSRA